MKLLSANTGYLLDYDGSLRDYARNPGRALTGEPAAEHRATERLVDVVADEAPELAALVEVDTGSLRTATDGQPDRLAAALADRGHGYRARAHSKYGRDTVLTSLPLLGALANGVLVRDDRAAEVIPHYIDTGPKRLVLEVVVDDVSAFVVHLALRRSTRRRQLSEIASLVEGRERVVLAGDFNPYAGVEELSPLSRRGFDVHVPGPTVPRRPLDSLVTQTRSLDLFVTSPDLTVTRCETIPVQVSDHRPVVLELEGA